MADSLTTSTAAGPIITGTNGEAKRVVTTFPFVRPLVSNSIWGMTSLNTPYKDSLVRRSFGDVARINVYSSYNVDTGVFTTTPVTFSCIYNGDTSKGWGFQRLLNEVVMHSVATPVALLNPSTGSNMVVVNNVHLDMLEVSVTDRVSEETHIVHNYGKYQTTSASYRRPLNTSYWYTEYDDGGSVVDWRDRFYAGIDTYDIVGVAAGGPLSPGMVGISRVMGATYPCFLHATNWSGSTGTVLFFSCQRFLEEVPTSSQRMIFSCSCDIQMVV